MDSPNVKSNNWEEYLFFPMRCLLLLPRLPAVFYGAQPRSRVKSAHYKGNLIFFSYLFSKQTWLTLQASSPYLQRVPSRVPALAMQSLSVMWMTSIEELLAQH